MYKSNFQRKGVTEIFPEPASTKASSLVVNTLVEVRSFGTVFPRVVLHIIEGTLDSAIFCKLLENTIQTIKYLKLPSCWIFQRDYSSKYSAGKT